ncbi:MAG: filamentous hemagglutinin N-terminal domain-containing protein [Polyangiales bacterium]
MASLTGPAFAVDESNGAVVGNTLYLSFGTLSLGATESLVIDGPATVEHVVVRVTGGSATQLDGPVTVSIAGASLILTNPAGITVGAGGLFTVPGDLVLTTADYVRASSGDRFQVPPFPSEVLPDTAPAHLGFLSGALGALTYEAASLTLTGDLRLVAGDVTVNDAMLVANHVAVIASNVGELALATLDVTSMSAPTGMVRLTGVVLTSAMPALVLPAGCGNGFVEAGEECDDGDDMSATTPDACRPGCVAPSCGDGVHDSTEGCDLGAGNSNTAIDGCRTNCEAAGCGDGVKDTGETCDMGAMNSDTTAGACRTDCTFAVCGDGVRVSGEQCDDGSANSDTAVDACRTNCRTASCGDGVPDTGEECDDGPNNSAGAPDACRDDCLLPRCGDRVVDTGEFCDDGPFNSDDEPMRCRVDCQSANGPLDLHGGACDVPTHPGGEWPLGVFVLVAVAVLVPLRRRGL